VVVQSRRSTLVRHDVHVDSVVAPSALDRAASGGWNARLERGVSQLRRLRQTRRTHAVL
jgi:hypothetical protein